MGERAALFGKINLALGYFANFAFMIYPIILGEDKLPYGLYFPGINFMKSPIFEISYLVEFIVTAVSVLFYIPFINMYICFVVFGITMVRILKEKFRNIAAPFDGADGQQPDNDLVHLRLRLYIECHKRIITYVDKLNDIVSTAFLVEIIVFGVLLCVLLFFVQLVEKPSHRILGITFIGLIMFQLSSLYWLSNQLIEEVRNSEACILNRVLNSMTPICRATKSSQPFTTVPGTASTRTIRRRFC